MKKVVLLIILILAGAINLTQAQEEIPSSVYTALEHLNEYLLVPMTLTDQGVEWDWAIVELGDFGENCRERGDTSAFLPDVAYDIHFYRMAESYHYRVSLDEQLIVRCLAPVDVPVDTLPALADAMDDLNRRFHAGLMLNDIPWTWEETQFDDYTLDCPALTPPDDDFDQTIEGYIIHFRLLGEQHEYRVSQDRLIVLYCDEQEEG